MFRVYSFYLGEALYTEEFSYETLKLSLRVIPQEPFEFVIYEA